MINIQKTHGQIPFAKLFPIPGNDYKPLGKLSFSNTSVEIKLKTLLELRFPTLLKSEKWTNRNFRFQPLPTKNLRNGKR